MPHVKLHGDGWVALPEALRRRLHLVTGAELEAELVEEGLLLRPAPAREARKSPRAEEPPPAEERQAPERAVVSATRRDAGKAEASGAATRESAATAAKAGSRQARLRAALMPVPRTRGRKGRALASGAGRG